MTFEKKDLEQFDGRYKWYFNLTRHLTEEITFLYVHGTLKPYSSPLLEIYFNIWLIANLNFGKTLFHFLKNLPVFRTIRWMSGNCPIYGHSRYTKSFKMGVSFWAARFPDDSNVLKSFRITDNKMTKVLLIVSYFQVHWLVSKFILRGNKMRKNFVFFWEPTFEMNQ